MTLSFLLLIVAAAILRYLAFQSKRAFAECLRRLFPRNLTAPCWSDLRSASPGRLREFRERAIPLRALQLVLDGCSCAALLAGLWFYPSQSLRGPDLSLICTAGLAVAGIALAIDLATLCRMLWLSHRLTPPFSPDDITTDSFVPTSDVEPEA